MEAAMVLEWMTEHDARLGGADVLGMAEVDVMLGRWREGFVRGFEVEVGKVAWCRVDSGRLRCLAIAPDDGKREVDEVAFFAAPFPVEWVTKRRASPRDVAWPADGFAFGMLEGGRVALARAASGRVVQPMDGAPWIRCEDHSAKGWHVMTARLAGARRLFEDGCVTFASYPAFRLAVWRADDPAAAAAARDKGMKAARAAKAAKLTP
jgi:hypothetical protein